MTNDYAIVPEDEFSQLKTDIKNIKSNPLGSSEEGRTMVATLTELNKSMSSLVNLFNVATDELKQEEHDSSLMSEKIGPLMDRIDNLEKQNEKIAKGIVAVADMIKDLKEEKKQANLYNQPAPIKERSPQPQSSYETQYSNPSQFSSAPQAQQSSQTPSQQDSFMQSPNMGLGMGVPQEMKPLPINNLPEMGAPKMDKKNMFHF